MSVSQATTSSSLSIDLITSNVSNPITLLTTNLRVLNLNKYPDWPGSSLNCFCRKNSKVTACIKTGEWILYRLFEVLDPIKTASELGNFFPATDPSQSLALRTLLFNMLECLKRSGFLRHNLFLRKSMFTMCSGARFVQVLLEFSFAVVKHYFARFLQSDNSLALQLTTESKLKRDEVELLLPLILTYKSKLNRLTALKHRQKQIFQEFDDALAYEEEEMFKKSVNAFSQLQDTQLPLISDAEVEDCMTTIRNLWTGDPQWLKAILYGDIATSQDGFFTREWSSVWSEMVKGKDITNSVLGQSGSLETLESGIAERKLQLNLWQSYYDGYMKSLGYNDAERELKLKALKPEITIDENKSRDKMKIDYSTDTSSCTVSTCASDSMSGSGMSSSDDEEGMYKDRYDRGIKRVGLKSDVLQSSTETKLRITERKVEAIWDQATKTSYTSEAIPVLTRDIAGESKAIASGETTEALGDGELTKPTVEDTMLIDTTPAKRHQSRDQVRSPMVSTMGGVRSSKSTHPNVVPRKDATVATALIKGVRGMNKSIPFNEGCTKVNPGIVANTSVSAGVGGGNTKVKKDETQAGNGGEVMPRPSTSKLRLTPSLSRNWELGSVNLIGREGIGKNSAWRNDSIFSQRGGVSRQQILEKSLASASLIRPGELHPYGLNKPNVVATTTSPLMMMPTVTGSALRPGITKCESAMYTGRPSLQASVKTNSDRPFSYVKPEFRRTNNGTAAQRKCPASMALSRLVAVASFNSSAKNRATENEEDTGCTLFKAKHPTLSCGLPIRPYGMDSLSDTDAEMNIKRIIRPHSTGPDNEINDNSSRPICATFSRFCRASFTPVFKRFGKTSTVISRATTAESDSSDLALINNEREFSTNVPEKSEYILPLIREGSIINLSSFGVKSPTNNRYSLHGSTKAKTTKTMQDRTSLYFINGSFIYSKLSNNGRRASGYTTKGKSSLDDLLNSEDDIAARKARNQRVRRSRSSDYFSIPEKCLNAALMGQSESTNKDEGVDVRRYSINLAAVNDTTSFTLSTRRSTTPPSVTRRPGPCGLFESPLTFNTPSTLSIPSYNSVRTSPFTEYVTASTTTSTSPVGQTSPRAGLYTIPLCF